MKCKWLVQYSYLFDLYEIDLIVMQITLVL